VSSVRGAFLATALATAATAALGQENSLNRPGSGARAAGMGNAFIAVSDDGTAASWNPAGLSQLRKPEISLVQSASRRTTDLDGYRTRDESALFTRLTTPVTTVDIEFASLAVPFSVAGRPVTLQGGWRRLYQLSGRVEGDMRRIPAFPEARPGSLLRFDNATDGNVDLWSLAGAVRFTSRLSAGWSMDFYRGRWEDRFNVSDDPGILGPTDFLTSRISNRIGGHSLNLGLLLAYPAVRIGAVYHGPLRSEYGVTQSTRSNLVEPFDARFESGTELHFPQSVGLGVAWLPRPLVRLALDVTYDQWTHYLIVGSPNSPDRPVSGFDGLVPELSATRDTVTLNAGLERLFPVKGQFVPLRMGFSREPQGGRDPLVRDDANQAVLAAGTGLNSNRLKLDVSLEYRWGAFRNTRNLSPVYQTGRAPDFGLPRAPEVLGDTRIREWRVKVSLIYRVTNPEKVKEIFKKAFGS
jgi:long-chain fatty acid transport protein